MKRADHTAHRPPQLNNEHRTGECSLHAPGPALSRDVQFCPSEVETPLSIQHAQHADRSLQHSTGYLYSESGLPIFYSRWRPTGQPRGVVLILHGLGEHSGRYRHLVGALHQADYVVYAHDHQGFGRSGGARCYVQGFHDYLSGVTQVLSMARRDNPGLHFCLYGHSMGGLIGLLYMMEAPGAADLAVIASPSLQTHDLSPVNRLLKRILELTHRGPATAHLSPARNSGHSLPRLGGSPDRHERLARRPLAQCSVGR